MVARIALYPDPLLAQVLTASTYWDQIPEASGWARQHGSMTGNQLARAMEQDLGKLRQYIKDVADSVAVLDTQMSDPAVLQKKLEHQRALTRP